MITLYGVYRSRASRPLWLLAECGADYTHVPVIQAYRLNDDDSRARLLNTASAEFLRVNPQGQIPAMEEDGLVLTESLAITLYLAKRHGGDLGPRDASEDAQMTQWALFAATSVEPAALEIQMAVQAGAGTKSEAVAALNAEKLRRPLKRLQGHLAAHPWLVGDRFTVADINTAECVRYAQGHPTLLAEFPAVKDWLDRCQARPGFKSMWAAREAEPL
ncbi:MAG: glutathione S-transferase family protein [Paracoccaceae bacterium]